MNLLHAKYTQLNNYLNNKKKKSYYCNKKRKEKKILEAMQQGKLEKYGEGAKS